MNTNTGSHKEHYSVDPGKLGQEIERLRMEEGRAYSKGEDTQPKARATLSNFIFLVQETEKGSQAEENTIQQLVYSVSATFPSRFFIIKIAEDEDSLKTSVVRRLVPDSISNLTEEIHIDIGVNKLRVLKNLILSNLVPDIETICVSLSENPTEEAIKFLKEIIPISESVIFKAPKEVINNLLKAENLDTDLKSNSSISIKYLIQQKINPWQDAIAQQFESVYCLEALQNLISVEISYSGEEDGKQEAEILSSWIKDRLTLKKKFKVEIKKNSSKKFNGIAQVIFIMNSPSVDSSKKTAKEYKVDCNYVAELSAIEVCASGEGSSDDRCDFSIRRIPLRAKNLDALLMDTINQD